MATIETKDAPILAAAVDARVDRFVTVNIKHLAEDLAHRSRLTIQTPATFVQELRVLMQPGVVASDE